MFRNRSNRAADGAAMKKRKLPSMPIAGEYAESALIRKRGELLERPFAHLYETGRIIRTYLRGHNNILKRILIHVSALNLGLMIRSAFGIGTPRTLQGQGFCLSFSTFQ
jgi:hypothetical protein